MNLAKRMKAFVLLTGLLCLVPPASAGSRGYYLAFVDVSATTRSDGAEVMLALRKSERIEGRASCWSCEKRGEDTGIAILYVKKLPAGVDGATVKAALTQGGGALARLQRRIREFADDDGTRLDGLYAYERTVSTVTLHAISPREGMRVATLSQPVKGRVNPAELDAMLEKLAKTFPFVP